MRQRASSVPLNSVLLRTVGRPNVLARIISLIRVRSRLDLQVGHLSNVVANVSMDNGIYRILENATYRLRNDVTVLVVPRRAINNLIACLCPLCISASYLRNVRCVLNVVNGHLLRLLRVVIFPNDEGALLK